MVQAPFVSFRVRGQRFKTAVAIGRRWDSHCGRYRVRETKLMGRPPAIYYAQHQKDGVWWVLSRHKGKANAMAACEKHARREVRR